MINEMIKDGHYDVEKASLIEKVHVRLFTIEDIREMLDKAGFISVTISRKTSRLGTP
jgi:phage terminase large subunit-like protein